MPIRYLSDPERLLALRSLALLDSPAEEAFDRLTRLATRVLGAPVALVSLVDEDRQFFKSQCGLPEPWSDTRETPLSHSFCQYAVDSGEPLVIEDAREHPLVRNNLAVRDLDVAAYAGIPLVTSDGHVLGSFCVIDSQPRRWSADELATLRDLAAAAMTEIELRADILLRQRAEAALQQSEQRLRSIVENTAVGVALVDLAGYPLEVNPALVAMLGYSTGELRSRRFTEITHPEDVGVDWGLFAEMVRGERDHYRIEKRYLHRDGSTVWGRLTVSAVRDAAARLQHVIGVVEDITQRKELEKLQERVKILEGLLPICMFCKKIRNEAERWEKLEEYITARSEAAFTHGCCNDCASEHFGVHAEG